MQRAQAVILSEQLRTDNQQPAATLAPPQVPQTSEQEISQPVPVEAAEQQPNLDGLPQEFDLHRPPPVTAG